MGTQADELRAEIDTTRADLTDTLNEVGERVSPGRIVARRTDRARERISTLKGTVMGTVDQQHSAATELSGRSGAAVGSAMDAVRQSPDGMVQAAQGNPIAAGLIAFGVGLLAASLLPATKVEQEAASQIFDKAQPVIDQARDAAQQVAGDLKESVSGATHEVATAAADAVGTVQEEAKNAAGEVGSAASGAASDVKDQAQNAVQEAKN